MAGAKETPRQKMIGMMYLVLTALLALQVNSAILLKFKFLDDSLLGVNDKTARANEGAVKGIQETVAKNRNQARDLAILKQSQSVRERTAQMVSYLRDVRTKLLDATENKSKNEYKNMEASDKVANIMLGGAGSRNGLGYKLKDQLNSYAADLGKLVPGFAAPALALDAKDDPAVTADQKSKDFAQLNFENTPVVAALAVLSQKETEVLKYEADALNKLAAQVGATTIVFDKIGAFASAESNTVAAGTKYKAELFLTASASDLRPSMTLNGSPLSVGPDGKGKIEFTATPGGFDEAGNAKKSWTGTIRFKQNGRDTTFRVTVPYTVTKPVMQIQSASVQALYFRCGNKLSVQVPALGAQYQPSFSASGANVIKGAKTGEVTLVPNSKEVTLSVSNGGNSIGSQTFQVRPIPKPEIKCIVGGREANEKQGTPVNAVRNMQLRAVPDAGFATFLPEDARYRVTRYEVTLVRGKRPAMPAISVNGPNVDLSSVVNSAREGDRLYIEVKEVQRMNFQGNTEPVNVSKQFNIPLL
ncbi:type IX secretion system motor protein PorM/GldM [Hymenobacter weizhouensis]|uniref:type IX secretion system motor protein PorM/GldM n=1 Tax=Hymenobacter sp. YIM 151500-1 TaxID=2987689 RepID=UPI002226F1A1|nr:gliding motility protein GldM [Hymenobacter sp. YIM 151500-1]UYZ61920.1 gliding motility protein GldM [Hymenobacter sp. YIM 151500-1]